MHRYSLATFIFIVISFYTHAQTRIVESTATKKGPYTSSQSSGNGADAMCHIFPDSLAPLLLCEDSSITLLVAYNFSGNFANDAELKWFTNDSTLVDTFLNAESNISDTQKIVITAPGNYNFSLFIQGSPVSAFCNYAWDISATLPIPIPSQTVFCPGGSVTLMAPVGTFSSYQWNNGSGPILGANTSMYSVSSPGSYFVSTVDNNNCAMNSDPVSVTIYMPPSAPLVITADTTCTPAFIHLNDSTSDIYPQSVTWKYNNDSVIKTFNNNGIVVAGGNGAGNGLNQLNQPFGIFLDSMRNVYVADYNNARIMKWAPNAATGEIVNQNLDAIGGDPTDVLIDNGYMYISTTKGLLRFSAPYNTNAPFNTNYFLLFDNAWGIAADQNHHIYFSTDPADGDIVSGGWVYRVDSTFTGGAFSVAGNYVQGTNLADINFPNGIYVDAADNVYVGDNLLDTLNNYSSRITEWASGSATGQLVAGENGHGNAPGQIWFAAGVALDKKGNMYVSDAINNRVQLWRPGADHGITIASGFTPWGIKLDDSANVYVADQTNHRVLKFPSLFQSTIAADTAGTYTAIVTYPGGCTNNSADLVIQSCSLPLSLLNFQGQLINNNALLTWQTVSESNTQYFNIERSTDATHFVNVGVVSAAGNSSTLLNYSYIDDQVTDLHVKKIYYRLEEVDRDGKTNLSNYISIDLFNTEWNCTISPNPVSSVLRIALNNVYGQAIISLMDITGRKLSMQQITASGNNVLSFNTSNLANGLYMIEVLQNGKSQRIKFEKQ